MGVSRRWNEQFDVQGADYGCGPVVTSPESPAVLPKLKGYEAGFFLRATAQRRARRRSAPDASEGTAHRAQASARSGDNHAETAEQQRDRSHHVPLGTAP